MKFISLLFALTMIGSALAQKHHPQNGVRPSKASYHAYINARIVVSPDLEYESATLLVHGDRIEGVGPKVNIPNSAIIHDCKGQVILPSFIEQYTDIGLPQNKRGPWEWRPQMESKKSGAYYWNESIHPEVRAVDHFKVDDKMIGQGQQMGFGLASTHVTDGIMRGSGSLVALSTNQHLSVQKAETASYYSMEKGSSRQSYPSSQMGIIALLKQVHHDLMWYENGGSETIDLSLEALRSQKELPRYFKTGDKWEILRAQKIAEEFDQEWIYVGAGNEYAIAKELSAQNLKLVLPLDFPQAYDVSDPYLNRFIPLSDLKHWELAPHNMRTLLKEGVEVSLTSHGLKSSSEFWAAIQKLVETGVSSADILKSLTINPAKNLGIADDFGTLEKGKKALFTVYSKHPFEQKAKVLESVVVGETHVHDRQSDKDLRGKYNVALDGRTVAMKIGGTPERLSVNFELIDALSQDTSATKGKISFNDEQVLISFEDLHEDLKGVVNLKATYNDKLGIMEGSGQLPNGQWINWSAIRNELSDEEDKEEKTFEVNAEQVKIMYPVSAYGFTSQPKQKTVLVKSATVWTNESAGVIENTDVLLQNGKIKALGRNLAAPAGARIIDGKGKHLTPGIIDEHSHIAISRGVNEGGQAISAEVSIGDVVNPDDINIYRQLSGGVTAAQLLHGSANPIGGQSALIKLRWGGAPDDLLIDDAPKFIKCALGENVKQSNWGMFNTVRFPQTRMGVEQVFTDAFNRALAYEQEKKSGKYRHDLELETLLEILHSERFISCHSYVQSEINMLMHVADSFGFTVNTFTHILEGYKVADKMAKHGAGGSTFSDWWAYKYEVQDAIPYNASLMMEQGVTVAINSDDAEMGRRLNQEAAKGIKYGGMSEQDALKMVTLNPAKLLHLDDRMGSIKEGKDADVVLWSAHPLDVQARAEYTIVDGQILFDREYNNLLMQRDAQERARILSKMQESNKKGEKKEFKPKKKGRYHCDTMGEDASMEENSH